MEFFQRALVTPGRLGILPGAFNPPTRAHLALATAALPRLDEVVFVLPRHLPHKEYEGAAFEERIAMLRAAVAGESRFSIAATEHGLFIDIAAACRTAYGPQTVLAFLCGRDAAERIVNWDYGRSGAFTEMLQEFEMLVASRKGQYHPPPEMQQRIHPLPIPGELAEISASQVRRRLSQGEPWEHLVPPAVVPLARRIYLAAE